MLQTVSAPTASNAAGATSWWRAPRAQLFLCLALALAVRLIVLARAHGILEGDEAALGIQAERLLHGDLPIYFPQQNYMGSWDAYLLAPLIALFGPSALVLHLVTTVESLLLVPLLGALAVRLSGERARLPAMLLAALPPLFVAATEIHALGGYVETLVLGTAFLLVLTHLAERWADGRSTMRLWPLAGFLAGLGFWIDPLILCFLLAGTLWLAPLALARVQRGRAEGAAWWKAVALRAGLFLAALLLGAGPTLIYAFQHQFVNYTFFFAGSGAHGLRLDVLGYAVTVALRHVVGFDNPWLPPIGRGTLLSRALGSMVVLLALVALGYTLLWLIRHIPARAKRGQDVPAGLMLRWWNGACAPLLLLVTLLLYWRSPAAGGWAALSTTDRYAVPATIAVSLTLAALLAALPLPMWLSRRQSSLVLPVLLAVLLVGCLVPYFTTYGEGVLQSPYTDVTYPVHGSALLGYLKQQHIHAVWTNLWIGQILMYLSDEQIICADEVAQVYPGAQPRFPETVAEVAQADRASFVIRADPAGGEPLVAQALDALHVTYVTWHTEEYWVITPLSRTVQPQEILTALKSDY